MSRSSPDPASTRDPVPDGSAAIAGTRPGGAAALIEWAAWIVLAVAFWLQTGRFDEEIASYALGATGWPRALAVAVMVGATGQLLYRLFLSDAPVRERFARETATLWRWTQRILIFLLPLVWLWVIPSVGFYVATPVFIAALLLVLEVRSPLAILGVTAVVYGMVLLIFTRFFYVGLPVGTADPFYDWNNWIIATARWGV